MSYVSDEDYLDLKQRVAATLERDTERTVSSILGTILLDWVVIPKRTLYPALAELLGVDCECRTLECKGCDEVEEWLQELTPLPGDGER